MYTYTHTHTYSYKHIYRHIHIHTHTHINTYTYTYTYTRYLIKLEHVQEEYLRVTDDMYKFSEEQQENVHNNLMREHELVALLTAPGEQPFLPLAPSASSSSSADVDI
jgi:hypothetical protein